MGIKIKSMNKTTMEEHEILIKAATDFGIHGETEIKCPRCGNEIELDIMGTSYDVKCKTRDCISAAFRGI
jgi:hypothetical protein